MKLVSLAWVTTAMLSLLTLMAMAVTVVPGIESLRSAVVIVLAGLAGCSLVAAITLSQFPRDHWVHQSRTLRMVFTVAAVTATGLVVLVL